MQFKYIDSYPVYETGVIEPVKTVVMLSILSNEGHTGNINIHLKGDHKGKSPEELIKLADDEFFSKKYSTRASEERYIELDKRIEEVKHETETVKSMQKLLTNILNSLMEVDEDETEEDEVDDSRESSENSEENNGGIEND